MAVTEKEIQLHKHGDTSELWFPKTYSDIVKLKGYADAPATGDYQDGDTLTLVTQKTNYKLGQKQDTINDLATIRSGAALGATSVQPSSLALVATSGSYNDLSNKPTITTVVANPSGATEQLSSIQIGSTKYSVGGGSGTVTSIKMNGTNKNPDASGVVDLGTVITAHQDISGKANLSDMSITAVSGAATIQLKPGTSITALTAHQDISGKADKVSNATGGNIAALSADGNLTDSGIAKTDIIVSSNLNSYLPLSAGIEKYLTGNLFLSSSLGIYGTGGLKLGYKYSSSNTYQAVVYITETNGRVGIGKTPSYKLDVDGDIYASGGITCAASSSDRRLKTDIKPFKGLDVINNMNYVQFKWNDTAMGLNSDDKYFDKETINYGVIAQDVEGIIDGLVFDMPNGYKGVKYEKLIPIMAQAIKELNAEVEELKKQIK